MHGQLPERIARVFASLQEFLGELLVGSEHCRQVGTERDARGSREGREVDQEIWRFFAGKCEGITEHQTAFGIRVADLHSQALISREDVTRPVGIARNRILDSAKKHAQTNR